MSQVQGQLPLDLANLAEMDSGSVGIAFKREVVRMCRDLLDRDKLKKKRYFTIKVYGENLIGKDGNTIGVAVGAEISPCKIPTYVANPHLVRMTANGCSFDPTEEEPSREDA